LRFFPVSVNAADVLLYQNVEPASSSPITKTSQIPVVDVDVAVTLAGLPLAVNAAAATGVVAQSVWGESEPIGSCTTRKFDTPVSLISKFAVAEDAAKNSACCSQSTSLDAQPVVASQSVVPVTLTGAGVVGLGGALPLGKERTAKSYS
jgi:hypothetical protein